MIAGLDEPHGLAIKDELAAELALYVDDIAECVRYLEAFNRVS